MTLKYCPACHIDRWRYQHSQDAFCEHRLKRS
ncbi:hypothetical protein A8926_2027 [Saccharopolyspora spinosa]|uniref:Uncharacterized protein n=1 Tax=Saccharopolyspora spinosa TaxID=60894 RepID=A0A2N3XUQ7_SACSN|nr:hypothetical protein A8926_2027 [Saccharopolyspora spinosa]